MNEYRIKISVKNNLILSAIEATGHRSVLSFCRVSGIGMHSLAGLIHLRVSPIGVDGSFTNLARSLMDELCLLPTELWTEEQLTMALKTNTKVFNAGKDDLQISSDDALRLVFDNQRKVLIGAVLDDLPPRQQKILRLRFGLGCEEHTLEEVAGMVNVTKTRVGQIEGDAIRTLKRQHNRERLEGLL